MPANEAASRRTTTQPRTARRGLSWNMTRHQLFKRPRAWVAMTAATAIGLAAVPVFAAGVSTASTSYDPAADPMSMAAQTKNIGATSWWNAGYTGKGIDVAIIDSGTSPVPGLDQPGKVVYGPDLSL